MLPQWWGNNKLVQRLKTRKTETPSAGRPSANIQSTTPPERRDRKKENPPLLGPLHTEQASLIRLSGQLVPTALLLNQQTTAKYSQGDSSFLGFFLAPTTSLWGLMGNYKIKNIKNKQKPLKTYILYLWILLLQTKYYFINKKNYIFI